MVFQWHFDKVAVVRVRSLVHCKCDGKRAASLSSAHLPRIPSLRRRTLPPVTPSSHRTPPDQQAVSDTDVEGPTSKVRALVPLLGVPWLALTLEELRLLPLDARAAYLLSLVDGHCTVEMILDICVTELAPDEALAILSHLLHLGAVEVREP